MTTPDDAPAHGMPFDAIVEQSVAGIYVIQDDTFVYANATWAAIVGLTPDEMIGMTLDRIVPADFVETVRSRIRDRLASSPPSMHFITRGLHRDGHVVLVEVHGSRMTYRDRPAVMGIGIDVTERLRNEEELRQSREQLQALTAYTAAKLEEQRLAIAREIHDVLGGMLTSIKMDLTRVARRADTDELQALTRDLQTLTQQTIDSVREISDSLRPAVLDHLDLSVALAHELQQFTRRSGIPHTLDADGTTVRLPPKRTTAVYRVFQEGLTNVARHAQATHVSATLRFRGDQLHLELRDDGIGFDPEAAGRRALGLLSMRERAREVGGELRIHSSPGHGTRLELDAPLL
jgi:PAS domain S-box-containing protein